MQSLSQIESLYATEMGDTGDLRIDGFELHGASSDTAIGATNRG